MRRPTTWSDARTARRPAAAAVLFTLLAGGTATAATDEPEVVARADWGSGDGQLGRRGGEESAPEGPMSFAITPTEEIWVLDQVNLRLVRFDAAGRQDRALPLGSDTFQDLALAPTGELVLLDRLAARLVRVLDASGATVTETPLEGYGIAEGGGTTALFARDDGVWVEYDHRRAVRVMGPQYEPLFFRNDHGGRALGPDVLGFARRAGGAQVELWTVDRKRDVVLADALVTFDEPVARIVTLAAAPQRGVVLAVHAMTEDPAQDDRVTHEMLEVRYLDATLAERRRLRTTPSVGAWEQFKELEVSADGTLWQLAFVADGVEVRRWRP
ncbi:MAG: hypothetical protein JXB32_09985 [Deltaproteobacteria bacterium]|nr:hypothetical protein [Deltaproteobacteria bacterium]